MAYSEIAAERKKFCLALETLSKQDLIDLADYHWTINSFMCHTMGVGGFVIQFDDNTMRQEMDN